jgi:hypothetical protein
MWEWIRKELSMHSGGESGIEKEKALLLRENLTSDPTESALSMEEQQA